VYRKAEFSIHCPSGFHIGHGLFVGFTLIELMVTLAVAAIVITIAAPSFVDVVQKARMSSQTNDVVAAVNLGRSRALTEAARVILCPTSDEVTCSTTQSWGDGWMIFVDCNQNGSLDAGGTDCINGSAERIVRRGSSPKGGALDVASNASLQFESNGRVAASRTFTVCVPGLDTARQVVVNTVGRSRVIEADPASVC